jgi:broad specificity phosphatase PhoE
MSTVRFVVRPGETEFDEQSRIQGSLDLPLTDRGRQQVSEIVEQLRREAFDVIYTSPTEPAASTAEIIGQALGIPVKIVDGLANLHQGLWQGSQLEEIRRKHPRVYKQWEDDPESVCAPNGEECEEAQERVEQALKKPLKRGESFVIVAPEPIATLITSVLRGEVAQLTGPIPRCGTLNRIERILPLPVVTIVGPSEPQPTLMWRGLPSSEIPAVM